jgi:hypothetical protein
MMNMRLTGQLLMIEDKPYSFKDENGAEVSGTTTYLHVLDGVTVTRVKVKTDEVARIAHLEQGDPVDLRVDVRVNSGARGAYLTITFQSEWETAPALAAVENF